MSKIVNVVKTLIGYMGSYFMLTILFLSLASGGDRVFDPKYYGVAALFAVLLSLTHFIFNIKFIPQAILYFIHIVLATLSFVIAFIIVSNILSTSTGFVGTVVFIVIDSICMVVRSLYVKAQNKQ